MHQGIFRRELLLLSLDFKFKTTSTPGITWQALSSPKLNMINVDKAYSVLIKNSNRYWINKHRLGPQAALVCQSALHWIDIGALSFEPLSPPHVSPIERGEQKVERQDIIPSALFPIQCIIFGNRNSPEEAGPEHRWRSVRQSFDPRDQRIRSRDL